MYNIYNFIKYTKDNPLKFARYCEIIMGLYGEIYLAVPSHMEKLAELAAKKNKVSKEEYLKTIPINCGIVEWIVSKEKLIPIWFDRICYPKSGLNRFQKRSIKLLSENGIIEPIYFTKSDEYQMHLWRKKEFGID